LHYSCISNVRGFPRTPDKYNGVELLTVVLIKTTDYIDEYWCVAVASCFPGDATVQTENGNRISMNRLRVGDRILTVDVATGRSYFDDVIAFLHRSETAKSSFVRLHLQDGSALTLSRRHLVYVLVEQHVQQSSTEMELGSPRFAESVKAGDFVVRVGSPEPSQNASDVIVERVVHISAVHSANGVYAPLTTSGNLVVDGVLASSYAEINSHRVAHWAMAPVRAFHAASKYLAFASWSLDYHSIVYDDLGLLRYGQLLSAVVPRVIPELFV